MPTVITYSRNLNFNTELDQKPISVDLITEKTQQNSRLGETGPEITFAEVDESKYSDTPRIIDIRPAEG